MKLKDIKSLLAKHHQEHLLDFWPELSVSQQENLLGQIEGLEWENIDSWVENYIKTEMPAKLPEKLESAPVYPAIASDPKIKALYEKAADYGKKLISAGKVAAFVVAGGQGTRLGFDGPKGNFPASPVKNKTLFRIFAEIILANSKKYNAVIPWYIMTSPLNHESTMSSFEDNKYFGLDKSDVFFFQQGTLPNFDFQGRVLLSAKDTIASSPDGHGGSLKALYKSGAIADMKKRGIEQISYFQVDNPLINIIDPLFIGLHAIENAQMSSKALKKAGPKEKVGNFCLANGRVVVIEYSDLPDELAEKRNADGSLFFEMGSIAIHIISRDFVEKLNKKGFALMLHRAVKKIPYINAQGNIVNPEQPNGVKLETFVFDALPLAEKSVIFETLRENEFAPVKNASGSDSPEVTRRMMSDRCKAWLKNAGINTPDDCVVEMSPLFAVCPEDVKMAKNKLISIKFSDKIYIE